MQIQIHRLTLVLSSK